jgi:predicted alpha-1,6-mannanase (GH76 family)
MEEPGRRERQVAPEEAARRERQVTADKPARQERQVTADEAARREHRAVARLLRFYRPGAGRWLPPTGAAWQLALAIEAVVTAYARTRDPTYGDALRAWLRRHHARRSRFFDDDGWYVNAWLRGYEVTSDEAFLTAARAGFADLIAGWDDTCGGGLWWNQDRRYKNAITTGLFLLAAARLARVRPDDPIYAQWARRAWDWFDAVGLINRDNLVNDGLENCRNNGGTTWTYNQGIIISALVELWRLTGARAHLDRAHAIATAATTHLVHPNTPILREPSEPDCDKDQEIFKGVLAQGLGRLCRADPARSAAHLAVLTANADAVWHLARDRHDGFGLVWSGPPGRVTPATHASATLLLGEVALTLATGASP